MGRREAGRSGGHLHAPDLRGAYGLRSDQEGSPVVTTTFSLVVVAAGQGSRMGEATAKQFLLLGGRPLWLWSAVIAQRLFAAGAIHEGVFVVPAGCEAEAEAALRPFSFPWTVTAGGAERSRSVLQGLRAATGDFVLVHDGARPFLTEALCRRVVAA
ncbi:MAG TPA: hypothetical protein DIC53_05760, partial [Synergistaceae bacterium]|nr:hypothetical protein [Synergistaceae bacterium]